MRDIEPIFGSESVKKTSLALLVSVASLAACSSASGPTFNAYELQPRNGVRTFRVDCHGILSNEKTCMKVATRMCDTQPVRRVDSEAPFRDGADPRSIEFQCGAAPAPLPAPVAAAPAAAEKVSLTGDTYFATDSATLTPAARASLDALLNRQADRHFSLLKVIGYTDSVGSAAHNLALSMRRAEAVGSYLREHGVNADSVTATGKGDADPVGSNETAEGRASNRRVEILLQK